MEGRKNFNSYSLISFGVIYMKVPVPHKQTKREVRMAGARKEAASHWEVHTF